MKFENPIINISMFEVENVVTASGNEQSPEATALPSAADYAAGLVNGTTAVKLTF